LNLVKRLDFVSVARSGESSIMSEVKATRNSMPCSKRHNRYQVCNEMFWRTWDKLNKSFKMNSSNLAFLVEMMISQLFWMTGVYIFYVFVVKKVINGVVQANTMLHGQPTFRGFR